MINVSNTDLAICVYEDESGYFLKLHRKGGKLYSGNVRLVCSILFDQEKGPSEDSVRRICEAYNIPEKDIDRIVKTVIPLKKRTAG